MVIHFWHEHNSIWAFLETLIVVHSLVLKASGSQSCLFIKNTLLEFIRRALKLIYKLFSSLPLTGVQLFIELRFGEGIRVKNEPELLSMSKRRFLVSMNGHAMVRLGVSVWAIHAQIIGGSVYFRFFKLLNEGLLHWIWRICVQNTVKGQSWL